MAEDCVALLDQTSGFLDAGEAAAADHVWTLDDLREGGRGKDNCGHRHHGEGKEERLHTGRGREAVNEERWTTAFANAVVESVRERYSQCESVPYSCFLASGRAF